MPYKINGKIYVVTLMVLLIYFHIVELWII